MNPVNLVPELVLSSTGLLYSTSKGDVGQGMQDVVVVKTMMKKQVASIGMKVCFQE